MEQYRLEVHTTAGLHTWALTTRAKKRLDLVLPEGVRVRARVLGIDAQGRVGPWSEWSEWWPPPPPDPPEIDNPIGDGDANPRGFR